MANCARVPRATNGHHDFNADATSRDLEPFATSLHLDATSIAEHFYHRFLLPQMRGAA